MTLIYIWCRVWVILTSWLDLLGFGNPFASHMIISYCHHVLWSYVESKVATLRSRVMDMFKRSHICSILPIHRLTFCWSLDHTHSFHFIPHFMSMMGDSLCPSFDRLLHVDCSSLSRKMTQKLPFSTLELACLNEISSHLMTSLHHWPSIGWFHKCSTSASFSHSRIVLLYLEGHCHYWWFFSCLFIFHIIGW